MKIKEGFVLREVAKSHIVVAVGPAVKTFNGIINLNPTSALLWKALEKGAEKQQLVELLLSEYDVSEQVAKEDVEKFVSKLIQAGLVE
jgi:hypothetical protein